MNRIAKRPGIFLLSTALLLGAGLLVGVQAIAFHALPLASPTVVATVNLEATFNGLEEWSQMQASVTQRSDEMQDEVNRRQESITLLEADLEDYPEGSEKYKEAVKKYRMAAIELQGYVQFQQFKQKQQGDDKIFAIYEKIKAAASTLSEQEGYDIILVNDSIVAIPENAENILAQISSRRVLFARNQMDITDQIITYLNAAYKASN